MKQAKLQVVNGKKSPNGPTEKWRVRMGKNGTGKQVGTSITVWPRSGPSVDEAGKIVAEIAQHNSLEIVD